MYTPLRWEKYLRSDYFRPYDKKLDRSQASHLLSRSTIGSSADSFHRYVNKDAALIVHELLSAEPAVATPPLKNYSALNAPIPDHKISNGETWVHDFNADAEINARRKKSLEPWMIQALLANGSGIRSKLMMFWIDFFDVDTNKIPSANRVYRYYDILLTRSIDGYADLLMELITENVFQQFFKKIKPASSSLSAFTTQMVLERYIFGTGYRSNVSKEKEKKFNRFLNEWSSICDSLAVSFEKAEGKENVIYTNEYKELFFNKLVVRQYLQELRLLLLSLLKNENAAAFLFQKIYRFFVSPAGTDETSDCMRAAKELLMNTKYDIRTLLFGLFTSDEFFQRRHHRSIPKTNEEFVLGIVADLDLLKLVGETMPPSTDMFEWISDRIRLLNLQTPSLRSLNGRQSFTTPVTDSVEIVSSLLSAELKINGIPVHLTSSRLEERLTRVRAARATSLNVASAWMDGDTLQQPQKNEPQATTATETVVEKAVEIFCSNDYIMK
jgi:hypothetical protein